MAKQSDTLTLTIKQFCALVPMSETTYFVMKRAGQGPREMRIGRHVRISREAAAAWIRDQEQRHAASLTTTAVP